MTTSRVSSTTCAQTQPQPEHATRNHRLALLHAESDAGARSSNRTLAPNGPAQPPPRSLDVRTCEGGYNSGRSFYLKPDADDSRAAWAAAIAAAAAASAARRAAEHGWIRRRQHAALRAYRSAGCQGVVALLIAANFAANGGAGEEERAQCGQGWPGAGGRAGGRVREGRRARACSSCGGESARAGSRARGCPSRLSESCPAELLRPAGKARPAWPAGWPPPPPALGTAGPWIRRRRVAEVGLSERERKRGGGGETWVRRKRE